MKCSERIVFGGGGATVHADGGYEAGEEGVEAQGRPLSVSSKGTGYVGREFMQERVKAEERRFPLISTKALAPYKWSFIKTGYLRIHSTRCQLPAILLFAIVLSASFVYSEAADPNSEEGNFDEVPPVGESRECCLCRYTKDRLGGTLALATSYISCYGKDKANVAKWTYPIETCDEACNKKNLLPGTSTPAKNNPRDQHGNRNTKIIIVTVLCLLILLFSSVCFCWARHKRDLPETRRFSSPRQLKGPGRLRRRSLGGPPSV